MERREREGKERGEEVKGRRREEVRRGLENNICVGRTKTERRQRFFFSFMVRLVVVGLTLGKYKESGRKTSTCRSTQRYDIDGKAVERVGGVIFRGSVDEEI